MMDLNYLLLQFKLTFSGVGRCHFFNHLKFEEQLLLFSSLHQEARFEKIGLLFLIWSDKFVKFIATKLEISAKKFFFFLLFAYWLNQFSM